MKIPWEQVITTESKFNQIVQKDQPTFIADLINRVASLEEDMKFALRHIRILEVDSGIKVIEPSWDEDDEDIVKCGECEYWTGYCTNKIWQSPTDDYLPQTYADDFCSYGERRSK